MACNWYLPLLLTSPGPPPPTEVRSSGRYQLQTREKKEKRNR
jgi:hypothetical protein